MFSISSLKYELCSSLLFYAVVLRFWAMVHNRRNGGCMLKQMYILNFSYSWFFSNPSNNARLCFLYILTFRACFLSSYYTEIYSGASVHERPCSRTIRFTNKFSEQKTSRMTNGLRTRTLATAASWEFQRGSQLLVNFGSVHIPAWFRFTNISVHERPPGTD
jgi:hypothetical protein